MKKIADKRINALAPGLSVAKAASATSAASATNSDQLDGLGATAFVRKAETFTRSWGCARSACESVNSGSRYSTSTGLKNGIGIFACNVYLPSGAIVSQARFTVVDNDGGAGISCEMWRTRMSAPICDQQQIVLLHLSTAMTAVLCLPSPTTLSPRTLYLQLQLHLLPQLQLSLQQHCCT